MIKGRKEKTNEIQKIISRNLYISPAFTSFHCSQLSAVGKRTMAYRSNDDSYNDGGGARNKYIPIYIQYKIARGRAHRLQVCQRERASNETSTRSKTANKPPIDRCRLSPPPS